MDRNYYLALRRKCEPENIRLIIVAESPPKSGLHFYDPTGAVSEPLFAAFMRQLRFRPDNKKDGLEEFKRRGWVLVDATYEPVNKLGKESAPHRDGIVVRDYPLLRDDLAKLTPDRSIPLVLMKENVCRLLEPSLRRDEFKVLNDYRVIPFPRYRREQVKFEREFDSILKSASQHRSSVAT